MDLFTEIYQQPDVIRKALSSNKAGVRQIAADLPAVQSVFIAARGTSDNAARYAKYLWGAHNQLPVMLAAPSLFSMYERPPRLRNSLVVGISQSGQSPDIVRVLEEGKAQGCPTLAITNRADSPMGRSADYLIDIDAGEETAVAATKSYTAQLAAIAQLSEALNPHQAREKELELLPGWIDEVLQQDSRIGQLTQRYRYMEQCVVLGRGFNYATAYEWSLKLKELTYVLADPYSSADFQHGPIAVVAQGYPVMAIAQSGPVFAEMLKLLHRLRHQHKAELLVLSDQQEALDLATAPIPTPRHVPEWLSPIVNIVPAQLFSYHLTRIKGFDTEQPRGLQKVTLTH
jgi:glucosamine--fructose-6-phosphate aminotransferase (isomerizing)